MSVLHFLLITSRWRLVSFKSAQVGSFRSLSIHCVWNVSDRCKLGRAALFSTIIIATCLVAFIVQDLGLISAIPAMATDSYAHLLDPALLSQLNSFTMVVHLLISCLRRLL